MDKLEFETRRNLGRYQGTIEALLDIFEIARDIPEECCEVNDPAEEARLIGEGIDMIMAVISEHRTYHVVTAEKYNDLKLFLRSMVGLTTLQLLNTVDEAAKTGTDEEQKAAIRTALDQYEEVLHGIMGIFLGISAFCENVEKEVDPLNLDVNAPIMIRKYLATGNREYLEAAFCGYEYEGGKDDE